MGFGSMIDVTPSADIGTIMAIMDAAFDPQFGERWSSDQLSSTLSMSHSAALVAHSKQSDESPDAVGFLVYRTILGESEMLMIGVRPEFRQQGIAAALIAEWENSQSCKGVTHFFLEVRTCNPAKTLYEKLHFAKVGVRSCYYKGIGGIQYDAITMRKDVCT
jgi:[ribosomal protein S18]-alanine N-acetyltransferase